jgi:hypothetical protein
MGTDWATDDKQAGEWLKLEFEGSEGTTWGGTVQAIDRMEYRNRCADNDEMKQARVTFSDGTSHTLALEPQCATSQIFFFDPVIYATSVTFTVEEMYCPQCSTGNPGVREAPFLASVVAPPKMCLNLAANPQL